MERVIVARTSTLPKHLQPMLATLTDAPFDDKDWIFEDKYDGFRVLAHPLQALSAAAASARCQSARRRPEHIRK